MVNIAETEAGSMEDPECAADQLQSVRLQEDRGGEPKTGGRLALLPAERSPGETSLHLLIPRVVGGFLQPL